ncbi:hypothetical protein CPAR01_06380 [Colletotrichum paranaense]|uniref:Uncharacterized protein n=3 Tax=Colletotrichum acutatum species complex TaxID=2707335 RepID=A0AAI9V0I8_9PEZI|nr:uncharacterized protein CPAR01_06380 [Colletotrichum paranaense]KAK1468317.1 hypothetical protein CMEL01_00084 [Colletotrichum melonis]KAK1471077.1 hypothetical protein CCUS01_06191 [Colletotrichum cuscutae]KAK1540391.1 hypothetical protein CPAR01_06380 [Colletotrichum paranaense]
MQACARYPDSRLWSEVISSLGGRWVRFPSSPQRPQRRRLNPETEVSCLCGNDNVKRTGSDKA